MRDPYVFDPSLFIKATVFAVIAHHGQVRRTGVPYVTHCMSVSRRLLEGEAPLVGMDLNTALQAALLHDVLEDTAVTHEQLEEKFGGAVASVVRELTIDRSLPKAEGRLKMIQGCKNYSRIAKVVKLADRWDNMSDLHEMPESFRDRYCSEALVMVENMKGTWSTAEEAILSVVERLSKKTA